MEELKFILCLNCNKDGSGGNDLEINEVLTDVSTSETTIYNIKSHISLDLNTNIDNIKILLYRNNKFLKSNNDTSIANGDKLCVVLLDNKKYIPISLKSGGGKSSEQIIFYENGNYQGETINGMKHGKGKMIFKSGDIYEGEWINDNKNGYGIYIFKDNTIYEGNWVNNRIEGKGKHTFKDNTIYIGDWVNNNREGNGKYIYTNGNIYDGDWLNDKKHGNGQIIFEDGDVYKGIWINDRLKEIDKPFYINDNTSNLSIFFTLEHDKESVDEISIDGNIINTINIQTSCFYIYPDKNYKILVGKYKRKLIFYNYKTNIIILEQIINIRSITDLFFIPEKNYMVILSINGIHLYQCIIINENKIFIEYINYANLGNCYYLIPLENNNLLVSCDKHILIYNTETNEKTIYLEYSEINLFGQLKLSNSLNYLAYNENDISLDAIYSFLYIINYQDKTPIAKFKLCTYSTEITNFLFSNLNENIIVCLTSEELKIFNIIDNTILYNLPNMSNFYNYPEFIIDICIIYSEIDNEDLLVILTDEKLKIISLLNLSEKYTINKEYARIQSFKYDPVITAW